MKDDLIQCYGGTKKILGKNKKAAKGGGPKKKAKKDGVDAEQASAKDRRKI